MNTCENCYFWHPANPGDESGSCWLDPPRVLPITAGGKLVMQNMCPTTTKDYYCRHHDTRLRPVIKVVSRMH